MAKRAAWKFIPTVTPEYNVVAALTAFRPAWLPRALIYTMKVEDFTLNKDDNGNEFVTFAESPTKTRQGGLPQVAQARYMYEQLFNYMLTLALLRDSSDRHIYYMEESVLLGTKPLVDSIRHFTRDPSGVFSV